MIRNIFGAVEYNFQVVITKKMVGDTGLEPVTSTM